MRFLKQVGDLLDSADEKTTDTDLQSLTRQVGDTFGAKKAVEAVETAKRVTLDFGIVEGLSDLKNQIGSDLKELSVRSKEDAQEKEFGSGDGEGQVEDRIAKLKERVNELKQKEDERSQGREDLQRRLKEVELASRQLQLQEMSQAKASSELQKNGPPALEAMQREFCEREAASRAREAATREAAEQAATSNEHLLQQLDFWRDKAKQMLATLGLDSVPEEIEKQIELEGMEGEETQAVEEPDEVGQLAEDHATLKQTIQDLEMTLAELMKGSEEMIGRVDEQHLQERDLTSKLAAAEELSTTEAREEDALRRKLAEVHAKVHSPAPEPPNTSPSAMAELKTLREEVETMRHRISDLTRENSSMEAKVGRLREKAAEDLERAVPSIDTTWWTCLDEPLLKLVTLLVKSTCLRRSFALHLLATYLWLFFLVFWLEKHP